MKGKYLYVRLRRAKKYGPVVWLSFLSKKYYHKIGLSFYPGILHEDVLFTLTGILLANRTTYIQKKYYHYRKHNDSIMSNKVNVKNIYGYIITFWQILKIFEGKNFENVVDNAINLAKNFLIKTIRNYMNLVTNNEKKILSIKLTNIQQEILSLIL